MSTDARAGPTGSPTLALVRALRPPWSAGRFWVVQFGVLLVAILDEVLFDDMRVQPPFGIPRSSITALLLVPVIYAALNFGVRGAVATALWATVLLVPDWLLISGVTGTSTWIEVANLIIVNTVAVVVGQRVEHEKHARQRAEDALRASELAEDRYRALFDEQHAPVLVANAAGVITEANAAAAHLFGSRVTGRPLRELLPTPVPSLLNHSDDRVAVQDRILVPRARSLEVGAGEQLLQIVLVDVTEEERRAREQQAYAAHLVRVQEDERRRLAQDLHDDPVQTLTYLVRMLEALTEDPALPAEIVSAVRRDGELATSAVDALRSVIHGLRPPVLDDFGVVAALRQLAHEVGARHDLLVEMRVTGEPSRLSAPCELTVYRVAQEALTNVVRHAHATCARLHLRFGDEIELIVTDDGTGMTQQDSDPAIRAERLGLMGMRERVSLLGGTLHVRANTPRGTRVHATVPRLTPEEASGTS